MERKNGFLTFLTALVPGVGYMYLGLMRRGVEALIIFLFLGKFFDLIFLNEIGDLLSIILWFYCFIDTFNLANRINRGEYIPDSDFIIGKIISGINGSNNNSNNSNNGQFNHQNNSGQYNNNQSNNQNYNPNYNSTYNNKTNTNSSKNIGIAIGVFFIIAGAFAILNQIFKNTDLYLITKSYINAYFIPVAIIGLGVYLLLRSGNRFKKK